MRHANLTLGGETDALRAALRPSKLLLGPIPYLKTGATTLIGGRR